MKREYISSFMTQKVKQAMENKELDNMVVDNKVITWESYTKMFNLHDAHKKTQTNGNAEYTLSKLSDNEITSIYKAYRGETANGE
tara:strand:- start:198 stop:452 length:255 start_codon:yes stop_codon:yes gene_type:complete